MKLRQLQLLRYGHLSDVVLDFPDTTALHIVHGANEAGKSTALAAIADGLFGFSHKTDFDFLHGAPQLRIGMALAAQDGTTGSFIRRKGRRDTLSDAEQQVLPEEAIRRFLGGASRELFEGSFGLNGTRLRDGGKDLLNSRGEAGESLLAGTGLLNLRAALDRLDEEAKSLFGDGRGKRRLSEATDAWRAARHEIDQRAVPPRLWQDATTAHAKALEDLAKIQAETRTLATEADRLQRGRRVVTLLHKLDAARGLLASQEGVPSLPPDAASRFERATSVRRDATRDAARETEAIARATASLNAMQRDPAVLAVRDTIDALTSRHQVVANAENDLPIVRLAVAAHRASVAAALADLGSPMTAEAARESIPAASARQAVQRLITDRATLADRAALAEKGCVGAQSQHDQAAAALAARTEPASPSLLRRTIDDVRGEGQLDTELARARRTLTQSETETAAALVALPLWGRGLPDLAACPVPLPAATEAAAARLLAAETDLRTAQAAVADNAAALEETEATLARLSRGEIVPTREAVVAARASRNSVWRLIRDGTQPDDATLHGRFETLSAAADGLADARADEAQRVADFETARLRRDTLHRHRQSADEVLAGATDARLAALEAWQSLWAPAGIVPDAPAAMADWRRQRDLVLQLSARETQARQLHADVSDRHARACAAIRALMDPAPGPDETLAALLRRADTACAAAEAEEAAYRTCTETLARSTAQLQAARDAASTAAAALSAWDHPWAAAISSLGAPATTTTDAAAAALQAWARIAEAAPAWRSDDARVAAMMTTAERFAADTQAVLARLDETDGGDPALVVAARLARRLRAALTVEQEADALRKRIAAHQAALAEATRLGTEAETDLTALREAAGAADDAALQRAIEQAALRDAATIEAADTEQRLRDQGDGLPEASLRAELADTDLTTAGDRLREIEARRNELVGLRETVVGTRGEAERLLASLNDGRDAAAAAQDAETALTEAKAAAERYARVHVARTLLKAGIDRFRVEQQGPLLRAAGACFQQLTEGRYLRLVLDEDQAGRTVLQAVPKEGGDCPVEGLSEGTRDQLYLALRIASIQAHIERAEPLPFIADDLLVHFDDRRAAAALRLLVALGRSTQVILFTHHDHIVELAAGMAGVTTQSLPGR